MKNIESVRKEVAAASTQWIDHFNAKNYAKCLATYTPNATLKAYPFGTYQGNEEIKNFWQEFTSRKPQNLTYRNTRIHVINDNTAILSASWTMNICSGYISKELWSKADGTWKLQEDDFTLIRQLSIPRLPHKETALICVDIQNDYFLNGKMPLREMEGIAEKIATLLSHFRKKKMPVIHIQHIFPVDGAPFFTPGGTGKDIHPSATPLDHAPHEPLHIKSGMNAFTHTSLEDSLVQLGVKRLIIVGAMAHICIEAIASTASNMGYETVVLSDCVTGPDAEHGETLVSAQGVKAAALSALAIGYSQITTSGEILAELQVSIALEGYCRSMQLGKK